MFNFQNVTSMIKYVLKQNNNSASAAFGKWYAFPVVEETMDLEDLAHHMEEHNTGFSEAMCVGVMKAMVKCIKEQLLAGKNVKIDNLAIFSCGIKNREGAVSPEEFTVANNISGVKLRARATGTLSNANLNLAASIKKASTVLGNVNGSDGGNSQGSGSNTQGSGSNQNTQTPSATKFTLTLVSNDSNMGTVSGAGQYAKDSQATIKATPKSGYLFDQWSDGNRNADRAITVTRDQTLVATFYPEGGTRPSEDEPELPPAE